MTDYSKKTRKFNTTKLANGSQVYMSPAEAKRMDQRDFSTYDKVGAKALAEHKSLGITPGGAGKHSAQVFSDAASAWPKTKPKPRPKSSKKKK